MFAWSAVFLITACNQSKPDRPNRDRGGFDPDEIGDDDDDDNIGDDDDVDTNLDSDGDGLTDLEEEDLGTDPDESDSDGDGWDDLEEVDGNTDPTLKRDHPYTGGWAIGACRDEITATGDNVGDIAEDFELTDQFGDNLHLHDFCDREVLLVSAAFW